MKNGSGSQFPVRLAVALICFFTVISCKKTGDELTSGGSSSSSNSSSLSCSVGLIDLGQKSVVAASARGTYSDTRIIPGSSAPAVAFIDQSTLSIKLSYWSNGQALSEVVAGDGAGAFVRLGFLSSGVPMVFWTMGTAVKVAIRSAALTNANAYWTAGVIDTTTAPRALEVAINPIDQVLLSYVTDTATAGRAKMAYCDAPCTAPSSFQVMNTNPYIENTAVVAATLSTGAAWCQASANQYYPAVSYSVTGNVKFATCQNSLSNCLNGTNWVNSVVVAAGNASSKLIIDTTIAADVPKVVTYNGANSIPYRMGSTGCTLVPTTFTAGANLGNYGSLWFQAMKDTTNGKYHFVGNSGTTAVAYVNSTSTDILGTWNALDTVETVSLPAASYGGAALDNLSNGIYVSYGINAANYDIRLTKLSDFTLASNSASMVNQRFYPDLTGMMQLSTAAGVQLKNIAAASTTSGRSGVAFVDFSATTALTGKLKYAYRNGTTSSSTWSVYIVPDAVSPQFPGIAFDQYSKPWISYFEANNNRFYLTTNSSTDGSGFWTTYEFPALPSGAPGALPMANNTAVAMRYSGGISNPVMLIIDNNATSRGVKAAQLNATTRTWAQVSSIDAMGASGGAHLAADFDTNGNVVAAFQDLTTTTVKYAYMQNAATWSGTYQVSVAGRGPGTSIRLNPSNARPAISYFDSINNTTYYSSCSGTVSSCVAGGWSTVALDTVAGVSGLTAATGQILTTSLAFNSSGYAHVLYPHGAASTDGALTLSQNRSGSFVNSTAVMGSNGAVTGSAALNFAISGWNVATAPNASGGMTGAFVGPGNWLYSVSCGD